MSLSEAPFESSEKHNERYMNDKGAANDVDKHSRQTHFPITDKQLAPKQQVSRRQQS